MSRVYLTSNQSFHVAANGSDANDGSQPYPWATLTHAYNWCRDNLDFAGKKVTVNVAAGTYAPLSAQGRCLGQIAPDDFSFIGNVGDCWAQEINAANANAITVDNGAQIYAEGFTCKAAGQSPLGFGLVVGDGTFHSGTMMWTQCERGYLDVGHPRGVITIKAAQGFFGSAPFAMIAEGGGHIFGLNQHYYLYGPPTFSIGFTVADEGSFIDLRGAVFHNINGNALGLAAVCIQNAVIETSSAFPGSGVSVATGGQIV